MVHERPPIPEGLPEFALRYAVPGDGHCLEHDAVSPYFQVQGIKYHRAVVVFTGFVRPVLPTERAWRTCGNLRCWAPWHLQAGTAAEQARATVHG